MLWNIFHAALFIIKLKSIFNRRSCRFLVEFIFNVQTKNEEPDKLKEKKLSITVRSLETPISFANAHAKIRLSQKVAVDGIRKL